ncbi:MAG: methyl-accepting chemotaxis protein [Deltaproteobacteria bacterium]|nr:methyl-accepting chemotaxis protein [Deltaproteobacteria bacterium]
MALLMAIYIPLRMNEASQKWAERRAKGLALVIASAGRAPYDLAEFKGPAELTKLLTLLEDAPGATYGAILDERRAPLGTWNPREFKIEALALDPADGPQVQTLQGTLHVLALIETPSGARGYLQLGFSMAEIEAERRANTLAIAGITLLVFVAGRVVLSFLLERILIGPITLLREVTTSIIATGNLTTRIPAGANDEIGDLAEAFSQMVEWQRSTLRALQRVTRTLTEVSDEMSATGTVVAVGAGKVQHQVEETSRLMGQMLESIQQMAGDLTTLRSNAEHGNDTILEMAHTNSQSATHIESMASFVETTTQTIDAMARSVRDIASSIEQVNDTLADTSSFSRQFEETVQRVGERAQTTAELSKRVADDADKGVEALTETLEGIHQMQASFTSASEALDHLVQRLWDVSKILIVIDDITEQTELLALNAAIISAQADRTKHSTAEINELINNVQRDSGSAIAAMARGAESVEAGVTLGQQAERALARIQGSSRDARRMVEEIAQASVEQADGNRSIAESIARIASTVDEIATASAVQAKGSSLVLDSTHKMQQLNQEVHASSRQQATSSDRVLASIHEITTMIENVNHRQEGQTRTSSDVLDAITAIESVSEQQSQSADRLGELIGALQRHAHELEEELGRFRVDG